MNEVIAVPLTHFRKELSMLNMKSVRNKIFGTMLVLPVLFAVFASTVVFAADAYPNKTVRIICPWEPGAGTDAISRMIAEKLSARLGKPVIVENRAGAGGFLGAEAAAKAKPDGYTLVIIQQTHFLPRVDPMPFDMLKSFAPIANKKAPINTEKLAAEQPEMQLWVMGGRRTIF